MPPGARVVDVGYVGDIEFITCVFDQGPAAEPAAQPQAAAAAGPVPRQREQAGRKRGSGEEPPRHRAAKRELWGERQNKVQKGARLTLNAVRAKSILSGSPSVRAGGETQWRIGVAGGW